MSPNTMESQPSRLTPHELISSKLPGLLDLWENTRSSGDFEQRTSQDLIAAWAGLQRLVLPDPPSSVVEHLDQIVRDVSARLVESGISHHFDCNSWQVKLEKLDSDWDQGLQTAEELEWQTLNAFNAL